METTEKENKPKRDKALLLLLVFMTTACAVFAWLYFIQRSETQTVVTENIQITQESEIVKRDLQQLQKEYEELQTTDSLLKNEIQQKAVLIAQMQEEAEKHKNDARIIAKLKKETQTLREIMKHFVKEIDSLNTLNKALIASKDSAVTELKTQKEKSAALQTEKDKLYKLGSTLKASGVNVRAYNVRGKDRQSETSKAKRTDKIQVAFVIGANNIAPSGSRTVYLRMVTPDGKEWTESADADHMFSFNNSKGFYAAKKNVQYDNYDTEVVMFIKKKESEDFLPGKYLIEVSTENTIIGSATMTLE